MSLQKALDKAIREENARFLADPAAQREAREQGERMREQMEDEITYKLWVNEGRTLLVRIWSNGLAEVAQRDHPADTWGPPILLTEEKVVRA